MKSGLILLATLASLNVMAAAKEEVINKKLTVSMYGLGCSIVAGAGRGSVRHRTITQLQPTHAPIHIIDHGGVIELPHSLASMRGSCDIHKLDQVVQDSIQHFGHLEIPVQITKSLSAPEINWEGKCTSVYKETLKLDLGQGIVLTSAEAVHRDATGCGSGK